MSFCLSLCVCVCVCVSPLSFVSSLSFFSSSSASLHARSHKMRSKFSKARAHKSTSCTDSTTPSRTILLGETTSRCIVPSFAHQLSYLPTSSITRFHSSLAENFHRQCMCLCARVRALVCMRVCWVFVCVRVCVMCVSSSSVTTGVALTGGGFSPHRTQFPTTVVNGDRNRTVVGLSRAGRGIYFKR